MATVTSGRVSFGKSRSTLRSGNALGLAQGLPDTKVGVFTQKLYDEAMKDGWIVISMKKDWRKIFAFEE